MSEITNNKTIAKNTLFMYVRMLFTTCVGLYTSRVLLSALGFDDYGLYTVVGGIIAMFGFINNTMTNATSRFITFYLGNGSLDKLKSVFSSTFIIHLSIAILIIIIGETIGLWYLNNKLVIPDGRYTATLYVYQISIISAVLSILTVPLSSEIVAHERMSLYAYIAILDSVLKLLVVWCLLYSTIDRLILYAILLLLVQFINCLIYYFFCRRYFKETRIQWHIDRKLFREIFAFAGWGMFGNFSYLFYTQGLNLMLNFFCGPIVNAARGIAAQVENVMKQFAANVQTAINPQIIKSYSRNDYDRMYSLIFASSKYCFFLIFLFSLPVILETPFILKLWLVRYPDHTINFLRLTLLGIMLETIINPMFTANLATGKVRIYQIRVTAVSFAFMPIAYLVILITEVPELLLAVPILTNFIGIMVRIFILKKQIGMPIKRYLSNVISIIGRVVIIASILPIIAYIYIPEGILRFLTTCFLVVISVIVSVYFCGLTINERMVVNSKIRKIIKQYK